MITVTPMSKHGYYQSSSDPNGKDETPDIPGYRVIDEHGSHWWPKARFEALWNKLMLA